MNISGTTKCLTAYINQEYIERAKQTKPFGFLVKPFKQGELYANIEMALHKHRLDKEIKDYLERLVKCYRGRSKVYREHLNCVYLILPVITSGLLNLHRPLPEKWDFSTFQ